MKKILVILDGAADLPVDSFDGRTPLEAAETLKIVEDIYKTNKI